jgi:hypothetical protein
MPQARTHGSARQHAAIAPPSTAKSSNLKPWPKPTPKPLSSKRSLGLQVLFSFAESARTAAMGRTNSKPETSGKLSGATWLTPDTRCACSSAVAWVSAPGRPWPLPSLRPARSRWAQLFTARRRPASLQLRWLKPTPRCLRARHCCRPLHGRRNELRTASGCASSWVSARRPSVGGRITLP